MIQTNAMEQFALSKVGCGYVYGATGWVSTPQRRARQAAQYPKMSAAILNTCKKWDGRACYDCAQLTRFAAKAGGVSLPSGATSQWRSGAVKARGVLAQKPDNVTCLVFIRAADGSMRHVGLCFEDGTVVHAKGSASGVVHEALKQGAWTHCALFAGELSECELRTVTAKKGQTVNLRAAPKMTAPILQRVPVSSAVEWLGAENHWAHVRFCDQEGYMMTDYLSP